VPASNFFHQVWVTIQQFGKALIHSTLARTIAGLVISGLSIYLLVRTVDLGQIGASLSDVKLSWILLVLISITLNQLAKTIRWRVLIGSPGKLVPFSTLFMSLMAGQLLNLIFPARIGDISRAYTVGGLGPGRAYVLGTVVIEKIIDFLIYLALFALLLALIPLPAWINQSVVASILIAIILMLALFVILFQRKSITRVLDRLEERLPSSFSQFAIHQIRLGLDSLSILKDRSSLLKVGLWTFIIWATAVANNSLTLEAFGIQLPITASLMLLVALLAGVSIPSAPGSIGIFEMICVLTLGYYGVSRELALSYGLVLHFLVLAPILVIGLISTWMLGLSRKALQNAEVSQADPTAAVQQSRGGS
jgi:glycosyltransferase 2 family protein